MIDDEVHYKDYVGSVRYSEDEKVFFGKIEDINDLVTFEGRSIPQLKQAFHEAVRDYTEITNASSRDDRIC
jgi:predicted HicB family RNase H-like nuclease